MSVSSFSLLDHSYLFNHLSQFVSLEDKCARLVHLNRALNKAFNSNRAHCCRLDTLELKWPTSARSNDIAWANKPASQFVKKLTYAPIVPKIIALQASSIYGSRYDWCRTDAWIIKAITGGVLQSFYLQEFLVDPLTGSASVTASILHHLEQMPAVDSVSVRELAMIWTSNRDYQWHSLSWIGLSQCKSLTTLVLEIPHWRLHDALSLSVVLPPSLVHVTITGVDVCSCYVQEWTDALSNPRFLPVVQTLDLDPMSISEGFTTVMESTNTIRPLERIRLIVNDTSQAEALAEMKQLTELHALIPSNLFESLVPLQQTQPKLKSLRLSFMDDDEVMDLQPFYSFLPRFCSSLETLKFTLGSITDGEDGIKLLSKLYCLKDLSISSELGSNAKSIEYLASALQPNCWPALRSLNLSDIKCTDEWLTYLLAASPQLSHLILTDMGVPFATVVALAGIHCPELFQLTVKGSSMFSSRANLTSLSQVQAVFSKYPLPANAFQKLFLVDFTESYADTAFHLLVSKFRTAPRVQYFKNMQRSDVSILTMRLLPYLRALWSQPSTLVDIMYNERCGGRTQDLVYLEYITTSSPQLPAPFGTSVETDLSESSVLTEKLGYDFRHLVFRISHDARGLDGRAAFFAKLAAHPLCSDACVKLSLWDRTYRAKRKTTSPKSHKVDKSIKKPVAEKQKPVKRARK